MMTQILRFRSRRGLGVLIAVALQCFPIQAQEQQGISGIGAQKCAILTARTATGANPNDMATVLTWLQGFISGLNMNAENDFYYDPFNMNSDQQSAQILTYCRNHPSEPVLNAALHLAQTFFARRPVRQ